MTHVRLWWLFAATTFLLAVFAQPFLLAADDVRSVGTHAEHPLARALRMARRVHAHIVKDIKDYSCILAKRERVDGRLRRYQFMFVRIRHEQLRAGRVVTPFSVYLHFLAPPKIRGREVLYVRGRNDDKLIARKGGPHFSYVTVSLDPRNEVAMKGNRYPITEIGIKNLVERLIDVGQKDMDRDPTGSHCKATFFDHAKVGGRECSTIQVSAPGEHDRGHFFLVRIFIDKKLEVPIRYEAYDHPQVEGGKPLLLEEYTYQDLKLNIGLTNDDFARDRLGTFFP